ncbi:hypothetical protein K439DRAFT_1346695 [Ramaria rubella]|nr:hypothetical protein K439DRAFT_1346695 [Ramaria rubella]
MSSSDSLEAFDREFFGERKPQGLKQSKQLRQSGHASSPIILSSNPPEPESHCDLASFASGNKRKRSFIISSDIDDEGKNGLGQSSASISAHLCSGQRAHVSEGIRLTGKTKVVRVETIMDIPKVWSIPRDNTTYMLDLSDNVQKLHKADGEVHTIDSLIRAEDHESWVGTSGSKKGDIFVQNAFGPKPLLCHRVSLECNGLNTCEVFDQTLLEGCARYEPDESERQAIWEAQKAQNLAEAVDVNAIVAPFYHLVKASKCKKRGCTGSPVMLRRRQGPSKEGKQHFIGCSAWNNEGYDHMYITIPSNVDEDELKMALETASLLNPVSVNPMCSFVVHPQVGNQKNCCM